MVGVEQINTDIRHYCHILVQHAEISKGSLCFLLLQASSHTRTHTLTHTDTKCVSVGRNMKARILQPISLSSLKLRLIGAGVQNGD